MTLRKITHDTPGLTIKVRAHEKKESPLDDYCGPGIPRDSLEAKAFASAVNRKINTHGLWAWCDVMVTATFGPLTANVWLTGCTYQSEADFKQPSGYYGQMVAEAIDTLNEYVENLFKTLAIPEDTTT